MEKAILKFTEYLSSERSLAKRDTTAHAADIDLL